MDFLRRQLEIHPSERLTAEGVRELHEKTRTTSPRLCRTLSPFREEDLLSEEGRESWEQLKKEVLRVAGEERQAQISPLAHLSSPLTSEENAQVASEISARWLSGNKVVEQGCILCKVELTAMASAVVSLGCKDADVGLAFAFFLSNQFLQEAEGDETGSTFAEDFHQAFLDSIKTAVNKLAKRLENQNCQGKDDVDLARFLLSVGFAMLLVKQDFGVSVISKTTKSLELMAAKEPTAEAVLEEHRSRFSAIPDVVDVEHMDQSLYSILTRYS